MSSTTNMHFNPLDHPACLETPLWLEQTAWAGHLPFAMFLISVLRPRVFVELGVDRGSSYCTFCQTVKSIGTHTECFGVDTWQGDEHAGQLSSDVLQILRKHHDPLYSDFSTLIQSMTHCRDSKTVRSTFYTSTAFIPMTLCGMTMKHGCRKCRVAES